MSTHDKTTDQIFNSRSFGISNGVITILAILAGFIATKASKIIILGTLLALLITDPLVDSYSVYVSMKEHDEKLALKKFQESLIFQVLVQVGFYNNVSFSYTIIRIYNMLYSRFRYNCI
jgi:hypothetical protein